MRMRVALFLHMTIEGHVMAGLALAKAIAVAILYLLVVTEAKTWYLGHVT